MKNNIIIRIALFSFLILILSGCTKEKAEAIKVAAENFRSEAIVGLNQMNFLFLQNVSVVKLSDEEKIESVMNDLNSIEDANQINAELLEHWSLENELGEQAQSTINVEFENLKMQYYRFEAIFTSLDKGSFFAKEAVKKAEKHAINLTVQLINFSKIIHENEFRFTSRRVILIEKMKKVNTEKNLELQQELLKNAAREFVELNIDEQRAKDEAIRQCLKAAESGRVVAELIKDYDKMSVGDILNTIKNSMSYAIEISGGNQDISDLLTKFEGVETTIKDDPYWHVLLDQEIK